jgi:hypothetical protein
VPLRRHSEDPSRGALRPDIDELRDAVRRLRDLLHFADACPP